MYEPRDRWLGKGGRFRLHGIYWLPNLFTTIALFAGFFSIVQAMNGHFEQSALAIFVAMVFDGIDGRVARFTHTQSAFGAEYDSLADMVSFGVAPALVIYVWALKDFSTAKNIPLLGAWLTAKLGWIAAFIYCACAALRLARFNTQLEVADKRFFQGLPSPAAACVVAGLVWAMNEYQIRGADVKWLAWVLTTGTSSSTSSRPGIADNTFLTATMTPGSAERSWSATRLRRRCTKSGRRLSSRSAKNSAIGLMSNGAPPNVSL